MALDENVHRFFHNARVKVPVNVVLKINVRRVKRFFVFGGSIGQCGLDKPLPHPVRPLHGHQFERFVPRLLHTIEDSE